MPVSTRPSDKFAFLLTGLTDSRYIEDLKSVFNTLKDYYNYPAANIWIVQGSNAFIDPGSFTGAQQYAIGSETDPVQKLKSIFCTDAASFINKINEHNTSTTPGVAPPSGQNSSVVIYTTGAQQAGAPVNNNLIVKPGADAASEKSITPAEFTLMIEYPRDVAGGNTNDPLLRFTLLNVIMQQDYSGYFHDSVIADATKICDKCFTNACGSAENSDAVTDGSKSKFTDTWLKGLRWDERLDNLQPWETDYQKYADQLTPVDELFLINLEQACEFVKKRLTVGNCGFNKSVTSETAMYLGKPSFLIQDGDPNWWESPDVYLTHPLSSDPTKHTSHYIPDTKIPPTINNRINVVVRNIGTHPVRVYRLGIRVYRTPFDLDLDTLDENGRVPLGAVLKPTNKTTTFNVFTIDNKDLYEWNTPFYEGTTHECIWAKAQMSTDDADAHPFDFSWSVFANEEEAQRNTDEGFDPPRKGSKRIPGDSFRGSKQHVYCIRNPFRETHKFIFCITPEYLKSMNSASMKWYVAGSKNDHEKLNLEFIERGFYGASIVLRGGESRNILGVFGFKSHSRDKLVRFPVEILINKISGLNTRKPKAPSLHDKFAAITGFTVIITNEPASLVCEVADKKNYPVRDAIIHIRTVNGLNKEDIPVNEKGQVILKNINPDVYCIKAISKTGESNEQIVFIPGKETSKVKLEIISRDTKKEIVKKISKLKGR